MYALLAFPTSFIYAQKIEKVYLDSADTTSNRYLAVVPENIPIKAFLFLLDGFGASPEGVLTQTKLPTYAAQQGILTIIPVTKTGPLYFGIDSASQLSLKEQVSSAIERYRLQGKDFFIGGFSIGGSAAVKYAQMANRDDYAVKPKAVFGIDPPLDWERFYNGAKRIVRLSKKEEVSREVTYMIDRIELEMKGTPQNAIENFYRISPYSFSDIEQRAVKLLIDTPIMLISEADDQWWLKERGYDYSYFNLPDHGAMINELKRLGNKNAILVTTVNKGYRKPNEVRHPHSWSIADEKAVIKWLFESNAKE